MLKNKIIIYITIISVILTTIISVIDFCCFDKNFYYKEYEKYNTLQTVKTSQDELEYITETTLGYLRNDHDDLDIMFHENGTYTHVFEDIELIHMIDVKSLYQSVMTFRIATLIISILGLFYIVGNNISIKKEYISVLVVFFVALALLGISCLIDFDSFWTTFHKIFFTQNDYWLLDPRTCILVNLFNGGFFFDLCTKICILSFGALAIYTVLVFVYEKKKYN